MVKCYSTPWPSLTCIEAQINIFSNTQLEKIRWKRWNYLSMRYLCSYISIAWHPPMHNYFSPQQLRGINWSCLKHIFHFKICTNTVQLFLNMLSKGFSKHNSISLWSNHLRKMTFQCRHMWTTATPCVRGGAGQNQTQCRNVADHSKFLGSTDSWCCGAMSLQWYVLFHDYAMIWFRKLKFAQQYGNQNSTM